MILTADYARSRVTYDPATGVFRMAKSAGRKRAGDVAGYVKADGYRMIAIDGRYYYAHRLAWLFVHGVWPADEIDHANGLRDDNRIENLRQCSRSQNMANVQKARGWHWHSGKKAWQALIRVNGKRLFLGVFKTEAEARAAYESAAKLHHGEFAFIEQPKPIERATFATIWDTPYEDVR